MVDHRSTYVGFLVIDGTETRFIVTASGTTDTTTPLAQHLNADSSPTGEYVHATFGSWSDPTVVLTVTGSRPYTVTASNLLTYPIPASGPINTGANAPFNVLDLGGELVKTGSNPPVAGGVHRMLSSDVLLSDARTYGPGWGSFDLGGTWQQVQVWGPRGSSDPGYANQAQYPRTSELRSLQRHFYV